MASSLAYLLSLPPDWAVVRMLNEANGTTYRLDRIAVSAPTSLGGTTTQVTLTGVELDPYLDDQLTSGNLTFTYERLELSVFLNGVLANYHPSLPCSTQNLLDEITHRIDQQFYGDDILLQELTRTNGVQYALTAKPESLRFVGSITLPLILPIDISTLYDPNLLATNTDAHAIVPNLDDVAAYVSGTDLLNQDTTIQVGTVVQAHSALLFSIREEVPNPLSGVYDAPWYADSAAPGEYNLYGAKVIYRGRVTPGQVIHYTDPATALAMSYTFPAPLNSAIPSLDSAVVIALNTAFCTNFKGTLTIPYSSAVFDYTPAQLAADQVANPSRPLSQFKIPGSGFVAHPRLIHNSVISLANGTAWNGYLNTLTPQTLYSFQSTPPVTMDGAAAWVATYGVLTPTNLYAAQITYNGQLRQTDLPAATAGLDRVLEVSFTGASNSLWSGLYPFYYASPVPLSGTSFSSTVGSQTLINLAASATTTVTEVAANGSTLVTSAIPPGLALVNLNGQWALSGTPTTQGSYVYYLHATNGTSTVFYTIYHLVSVTIGTLQLAGSLAPATEGDATWQTFLDILGGQAPYTLVGMVGDLPSSISVTIQHDTVHLAGSWNDIAVHHFNLEIGSADGQSASASYTFQATGTALEVTASTSLTGSAYTEVAFTGNYTVVGGQAPYTYQTTSGTFPPGLLLNGGTGLVMGTPTAPGAYTWTTTVTSSDGFTGSVTTTLTVVAATYAAVVGADHPIGYWPCNETSGTVLTDASGNGHHGVISSGVTYAAAPLWPGSTGCLGTTSLMNQAAYVTLNAAMPTGTVWAIEAVGEAIGTLNTFWNTLLALNVCDGSDPGDPGIYAGDGINWAARVAYIGGDIPHNTPVNPTGKPAHVVLERDGTTANFYVNGALNGTLVPGGWKTPGTTLYILGSGTYASSCGMVGFVSDVAIYGQALGPQRVLAHAQFLGFA